MAFPTGWNRKVSLTVVSAKVSGTNTDFPVLIAAVNLPNEMLTLNGANSASNGGGDIRVSSDSAGVTQLPLEVVDFTQNSDPTQSTAELWVKIASATNTSVIWVWYNAVGQSQPSDSSTFGKNKVWVNYVAVWHSQDTSDSTGNGFTLTSGSPPSLSTGQKIGDAYSYSSGGQEWDYSSLTTFSNTTLEAWVKPTSFRSSNRVIDIRRSSGAEAYVMRISNGNVVRFYINSAAANLIGSTGLSTGTYYQIGATYDGSLLTVYLNGVSDGTSSSSITPFITDHGTISLAGGGESFIGIIDEPRISSVSRSSDWMLTQYNNQNSPSTFFTTGTPQSNGTAALNSLMSIPDGFSLTIPDGFQMQILY